MVRQISRYALDGYILNPGATQDHFSGLLGADSSLAEYLAVFAETSVHIGGSSNTDQYSCNDQDVSGIKIREKEWHT